jgi:hypothetical protein
MAAEIDAGGVRPRLGRDLKDRCLTVAEREEIALGRAAGESLRSNLARGEQVTIYPNRIVRGYVVCLKTEAPCERIVSLMKKPVAAVLDWLWDRFTHFVMNQGRTRSSSGHP